MAEVDAAAKRAQDPALDPAKGKSPGQKAAYDAFMAAVLANAPYNQDPEAGMTAAERVAYEKYKAAIEAGARGGRGNGDNSGIEGQPWSDASIH